MATPNYGYEKRQKELAKKQKKEEKLRAKSERRAQGHDTTGDGQAPAEGDSPDPTATPGDTHPA